MHSSHQNKKDFPNNIHVMHVSMIVAIALLATANWYVWQSIQSQLVTLEQNTNEQFDGTPNGMEPTSPAERPSVEERLQALADLAFTPPPPDGAATDDGEFASTSPEDRKAALEEGAETSPPEGGTIESNSPAPPEERIAELDAMDNTSIEEPSNDL